MQVFISYSFQDGQTMNKLKSMLQRNGIYCYIADHDKNYGDSLSEKLEKEIENSDCLIVIWTKNSTSSSTVGGEIGYAKKAGKKIIPLVEEGVPMPVLLQGKEYVSFTSGTLDNACQKILKFMNTKLVGNNNGVNIDDSTDETMIIENGEAQIYSYDLEEDETLVGQIKSDKPVNIFIVNNRNLRLFKNDDEFNYEDGIEKAKKFKISFSSPYSGTWNVIIQNEQSDDAEVDVFFDVK